jgi:hypothetical protein
MSILPPKLFKGRGLFIVIAVYLLFAFCYSLLTTWALYFYGTGASTKLFDLWVFATFQYKLAYICYIFVAVLFVLDFISKRRISKK